MDAELEKTINRIIRAEKRRKIGEPNADFGQYVDRCHWSKTGWAIHNKGGDCTCWPARKPSGSSV